VQVYRITHEIYVHDVEHIYVYGAIGNSHVDVFAVER
jgi:hypothetical protein